AGTACFVLPYLLLAAPAGYLADRYSKRSVIVSCKLAEIVVMVLAAVAILVGNPYFLFIVVALMGAQSALFGPSKLGSIPEMLPAEKISAANGIMGLITVTAIVVGTALGSLLNDHTGDFGQQGWWLSALVLIGVAVAGWAASLLIAELPIANPKRTFPYDAHKQTVRDLMMLGKNRALLRVAMGVTFFWSLGALAQMNIDQFVDEGRSSSTVSSAELAADTSPNDASAAGATGDQGTQQTQVVPLLISLVIGVGLGSILAGVWSGGRVELGILPLGAGGIVVSSILLFTVQGTLITPSDEWTILYVLACLFLFMLGLSAGLFDVPLAAFMQHRSPPESRGSILAATNFMTFAGMLVSAGIFGLLRTEVAGEPFVHASTIFLLCGVATIPVFVYIVWLIPQSSIRFLVWLATHTIYRVRTFNRENLPEEGGALLVANHVSWVDGLLLMATSSRPMRMIIDADYIRGWWIRGLARIMGAIPIKPTPKAIRSAIDAARESLKRGELVCIFPEGEMTRTGQLQPFKAGMMEILKEAPAPVIPVYLDELWGSIFSFRSGHARWRRPQHVPDTVSVWFGAQIAHPENVLEVRQAVQHLEAEAVQNRKLRTMILPRTMLRQCRRAMFRRKVSDSSGVELTGGSLLMRTLILRRLLLREVLGRDEPYVGILIPPSVGGVLTNAAVALAGRTSANLNYTVSSDVMNECIAQAGIRHVLTSRKVMEKLDLQIDAQVIYLEDFREKVRLSDKLIAAASAYLCPIFLLERLLGLTRIR
ncbi:MAG: MFS transporter, partial [Thermoguttaceae bacterium]